MQHMHGRMMGDFRPWRVLITITLLALGWEMSGGGVAPIAADGPSANVSVFATGLNGPRGLTFDRDGLLYALELTTQGNAPPTPGTGKVVRITKTGAVEDIATGLVVPTAMAFGPDGALYVSNFGAAPAGTGQIVRITIPAAT